MKGEAERRPQLSLVPSRHTWGSARRNASPPSPLLGSYLGFDALPSPSASSRDPGGRRAPPSQGRLKSEVVRRPLKGHPQNRVSPIQKCQVGSTAEGLPLPASRSTPLASSLNTTRPASFSREHNHLPARLSEKKMQTERMWLERQGEGKEPQRKEDFPRNLGLRERQEFSENLQLQSGHDSAPGSVLTEGAGGTSQCRSGTGVSGPALASPPPASPRPRARLLGMASLQAVLRSGRERSGAPPLLRNYYSVKGLRGPRPEGYSILKDVDIRFRFH